MRRAGVDLLVSMLTPEESDELGLNEEAALCQQAGIAFHSFPIPDRTTPESFAAVYGFVSQLRTELAAGKSVATHCRASIGRSSLVLACVMCLEGWTPDEAFRLLTEARGTTVPDTAEQVRWVHRFAEQYA
jgi:protein-tyrosine phosphatase